MSKEIKKLVQFISECSGGEKEKKSRGDTIDKEVLSITRQLYPIRQIGDSSSLATDRKQKAVKWVQEKITIGQHKSDILRWIPQYQKDKEYTHYDKYQVQSGMVQYSDQDYNKYLQYLDPSWSREETDYLWKLCEMYDSRFIVVNDRYEEKYKRSIEEIKKRYYEICHKIAQVKDQKSNVFYNFEYDSQYEKTRKYQLEKYLLRGREKNEEERALMEELKKAEAVIRREEREQNNLRKALNIDEDYSVLDEQDEHQYQKLTQEINQFKQSSLKVAYLRSSLVHASLPFSQKLNKQIAIALNELNIPVKPLPTQKIETAYDGLRSKILRLFKLQQIYIKVETEKKILDERNMNKSLDDNKQQLEYINMIHSQFNDEIKRNFNIMQNMDPVKKKVHI